MQEEASVDHFLDGCLLRDHRGNIWATSVNYAIGASEISVDAMTLDLQPWRIGEYGPNDVASASPIRIVFGL